MSLPQAFRLGVNYWPSRTGMTFWKHWDDGELNRDFASMKGAGLDSLRLFLLWEDFQPSPSVIDQAMLGRLLRTLDCASRHGLGVMPTLFTGHMSGANWLPGWAVRRTASPQRFPLVSGGRVIPAECISWYADKAVRSAQTRLARECATAVAGHPALFAWDLGNENSNCVVPADRDSARAWLVAMTDALRRQDPKTPITLGLHMEDLQEDRGLSPADAADACDFLTMHGYPGYAPFTAGPTDERLLPFLVQLTQFLGNGKSVLFSEFGVPTVPLGHSARAFADKVGGPTLVSEAEAAAYVRRGLSALWESGTSGAMLWCFADYCSSLFGGPPFAQAPHERYFGMFRSDGTAKPAVDELRAFARQRLHQLQTPRVAPSSFIDLCTEDYYDAPERHLPRLFERYCTALSVDCAAHAGELGEQIP